MNQFPVSRSAFRDLSQDELANFAQNILQRCKDNPDYAALNPLIAELETAQTAFAESLIAARNRAIENVAAKRAARAALLAVLNRFANALEFYATAAVFVVNAGMQLRPGKQARPAEIPAPRYLKASPTGNPGEILLMIDIEAPRLVQTNAVEYSIDSGASWSNGTYSKRRKILVHNLPSNHYVQFRVRSIGTRNRVSAWTAPVMQVVL